jgi:hypothetical protein
VGEEPVTGPATVTVLDGENVVEVVPVDNGGITPVLVRINLGSGVRGADRPVELIIDHVESGHSTGRTRTPLVDVKGVRVATRRSIPCAVVVDLVADDIDVREIRAGVFLWDGKPPTSVVYRVVRFHEVRSRRAGGKLDPSIDIVNYVVMDEDVRLSVRDLASFEA